MIARLITVMAAFVSIASAAYAAPYPDRPVKIVVPYTAGGSVDLVSREVARRLEGQLGQTFIVENKSGASANIGAAYVAKSDADGYTLLMSAATTLAAAPSIFKNLTYDPRRDLTPVALIAAQPNVLVVHPSVKADNIAEFMALAKSSGGKLNCAIVSVGGPQHMSAELFASITGTKLTQVPYRGGANAITDLLGGQVNVMFAAVPEALQHIKSGKLRALAVTTRGRSALLPDVPSLHEAGLTDYELIGWIGLAAPAGVPEPVLSRLNASVAKILADPQFKTWLNQKGLEPQGGTVAEFKSFVDKEVAKYGRLVKAAGIQPM